MTTVACLVAGKAITARVCVDAQRDTTRCWCPRALQAILAVEPDVQQASGDPELESKKRRVREDLVVLKGRCEGMLRKPKEQRYNGPALQVINGQKPSLSASAPLPAPPKRDANEKPPIAEPWRKGAFIVEGAMDAPARRSVPEVDEREDLREEALQAQELGEDRPAAVRKGESRSLVGGVHAGGTSRDASEPAATGVRRPPAGEVHTDRLSNQTSEPTPTRTRTVGAEAAGAQQVPNGPIDDRRPRVGVDSDSQERKVYKSKAEPGPTRLGRLCSVNGCARVLADKTKGDKCAPCCKGIKPGSGWEPCTNAPRCPRMAQRWKSELCNLCRQGKKYHLVPGASAPAKEKAMGARGPSFSDGKKCEKCGKPVANINTTRRCKKHREGSSQPRARRAAPAKAPRHAPAAPPPNVPPPAEKPPMPESFAGMPEFHAVPIGWTVGFLKYLQEQKIQLDGIAEAA